VLFLAAPQALLDLLGGGDWGVHEGLLPQN
jgi:hypothetical protein